MQTKKTTEDTIWTRNIPDPYNKKLWQFSTASNDGFFNGGNAFATLFHLSNVDDKSIIPSWLTKPPKITFTRHDNDTLTATLTLRDHDAGEYAAAYVLSYVGKAGYTNLTDAEALIASSEHLHPQNCVTPGIFQRAYNQTASQGTVPIFQATGQNLKIDIITKNFEPKFYSTSGIRVVTKREPIQNKVRKKLMRLE